VIFIVVKFPVRPDKVEQWPDIVSAFTQATRAEPGNLFFEWSRSLDDPNTYVLVEAFADADAGTAHVQSDHFAKAIEELPAAIAATPQIVNVEVPQDGWGPMAEMQPR
jgi:quinol monooxygenase YgiN